MGIDGRVHGVNIVVVAQEAAGIQTVRLVAQSPHHLAAVLTEDGRGDDDRRGATVSAVAGDLGIPVLPGSHVREPAFAAELRRRKIDVLLNVHSLYIIDSHVLSAPRVGTFNLHPGPLPQYAGLNVPSWALYRGESTHGVTLHWVSPLVDAGPIAFEASFSVTEKDTGLSVSARCVQHGMPLISQLLAALAEDAGRIPRTQQVTSSRRYFGREIPHQGWVPWQCSARQVVNFVRACDYGPWPSPWGTPRTRCARTGVAVDIPRVSRTGEPVDAPPGTVAQVEEDCALAATADEWVRLSRVRVDGKSMRPAAAFVPGDCLEAA